MTLIKEGTITSIILILLGLLGYFGGGAASVTALIPAIFGLLILVSVVIAKKNLKAGMHMAALFALLGFLAPLGRLIPQTIKNGFEPSLPVISQILMVLVCGFFLVLCIKSFIDVRKERKV